MSAKRWFGSIQKFCDNPWVQGTLITLYYLAIIIGLILMYGKGDFSTPKFIYQGF